MGLNDQDFKFGLTKVFFRPGKFAEFDTIMRADPAHLAQLVNRVQHWLLQSRWKKAQWCALSVIKLKNKIIYRREHLVVIQKFARMYLARKKYRPRINGIRQLKGLEQSVKQTERIANQLKKNKESSVQQIQQLQSALDKAIKTIRSNDRINEQVPRVILKL